MAENAGERFLEASGAALTSDESEVEEALFLAHRFG